MTRLLSIALLLVLCGCVFKKRLPPGFGEGVMTQPPVPALAAASPPGETSGKVKQQPVGGVSRPDSEAVVLPPAKSKLVMFKYPPGIFLSDYKWRLWATGNGGLSWFTITMDKNNTDVNGIVTITADKECLWFRPEGVQ